MPFTSAGGIGRRKALGMAQGVPRSSPKNLRGPRKRNFLDFFPFLFFSTIIKRPLNLV